ncbi:hypothetical protein HRV97_04355 [Sphingomonas sp. HHU CXW]|uniref:Secreted protein n=1 Tax=Sphingomonas hominis TaxID=2741495 RepID=A0ABX2JKL4_9SPHN|nr:hypothetical protein [Sphingomonas hominis]NTS64390.1 hypothetical protein [Sphingomonas hominis]
MQNLKRASLMLMLGCATAALTACGADDIASPGEGVIVLPSPTPAPAASPTPTPSTGTGLVTAAASCPTITGPNALTDAGTVTGPTGTYRACTLPARFTATTTLPRVSGVVYRMNGRVDVGTDAGATSTGYNTVLNIDPGVVIYAEGGPSFMAVNRGNQLNAVGTPTAPIIFTSRANVVGQNDVNSQGQWGGIVLLGRAPITDCSEPGAVAGSANCTRDTEGTSGAIYGGAQPTDNSGRMSYVQIRYSGFALAPDRELQSLTPSGVGSGTQIDHFQSVNSSDDGIEVFGGRPNMNYLVISGADDDSLDTDVGYKGFIQYVIAIQRPGGSSGDAMIEHDSNGNEDAVPRSNVRLANFTFIHRSKIGSNASVMLFRGGGDYSLYNGVVVTDSGLPCVRINSATTVAAANSATDKAGPPSFTSVLLSGCSPAFSGTGGVTTDQVAGIFNGGRNNNAAFTSTLTSTFINGSGETAATAVDPSSASVVNSGGFFQSAPYVGAVRNASDTWYRNWTCNLAYADFGSTNGSCLSLPTT